MDEYERLETLRKRLRDQERWDGLSNDELRNRRYKVERAIRDLLLTEPLAAATAPVSTLTPTPWWTHGRKTIVQWFSRETIEALEIWLAERLATAPASSASSPSTATVSSRPLMKGSASSRSNSCHGPTASRAMGLP